MTHESFDQLVVTLKRAAAALRDGDVPFLLGGGLAAWARGGPPTEHDVDLFLRPGDAERALDVLAAAGMRTERPPEHWLVKAWDGDILVDLIFEPVGVAVDDAMFERGDDLEVEAVRMCVMSTEDILVTKLLALSEHHLDYDRVLELARALREQVDWESVRARTESSPFAAAFMTLVDQLGISGTTPASPVAPVSTERWSA